MPRAAFLARYPHPWLLRELSDEEAHFFVGNPRMRKNTSPPATTQLRMVASVPQRLLWMLQHGSDRVAVVAITKRPNLPWSERVLLGRASNNDIVLPDASVSQLHAQLVHTSEGWCVQDLGSTNGVRVDGRRLDRTQPLTPLRSRAAIDLGAQRCEFVDGGDLHEALAESVLSGARLA